MKLFFLLILLALLSSCTSFKGDLSSREIASPRDSDLTRGNGNIGNGGDVVVCQESQNSDLRGLYVLDEALSDREANIKIKNSDDFLEQLIDKLKKHTFLGYEFEYFYKSYKNRDKINPESLNLKWIPNDGELANIDDEKIYQDNATVDYLRSLPKNCNIKQVVVRTSNLKNIELFFNKRSIKKLIDQNKIDWLIIHEFFWNYFNDVRFVREMNSILHNKDILEFTTEKFSKIINALLERAIENNSLIRPFGGVGLDTKFQNIGIATTLYNKYVPENRYFFDKNTHTLYGVDVLSGVIRHQYSFSDLEYFKSNFIFKTTDGRILLGDYRKNQKELKLSKIVKKIDFKFSIHSDNEPFFRLTFDDNSSVCLKAEGDDSIVNCPSDLNIDLSAYALKKTISQNEDYKFWLYKTQADKCILVHDLKQMLIEEDNCIDSNLVEVTDTTYRNFDNQKVLIASFIVNENNVQTLKMYKIFRSEDGKKNYVRDAGKITGVNMPVQYDIGKVVLINNSKYALYDLDAKKIVLPFNDWFLGIDNNNGVKIYQNRKTGYYMTLNGRSCYIDSSYDVYVKFDDVKYKFIVTPKLSTDLDGVSSKLNELCPELVIVSK